MDSETQQEWVLQTPCREGLPKGWKGHRRRRSSHHRTQESRSTPEAAGYHTVEQTSSLQCQRSSSTTQKMSEMQILRLYPAAVLCCAESCPTLCDPMDCNPPGSSVHGILQSRILEWVVISFCRGSSQPKDQTQVSCIAGGFFTS